MPKAKKGFLDGYKTYDPETEGYGSPAQWRAAFAHRMSQEEAEEVFVGKQYGPWAVLGVPEGSPWKVVKSTFRRLSMACHPDRCILNNMTKVEAEEKFKELTAAFTLIDNEYTRKGLK
jgi:DnaJ-class molecular chaperone